MFELQTSSSYGDGVLYGYQFIPFKTGAAMDKRWANTLTPLQPSPDVMKRLVDCVPAILSSPNPVGRLMGSDPEVFAFNKDGSPLPAWEFLPSHAEAKQGVYWDGVQAELSTDLPNACHAYFVDSIQRGLKAIYDSLKAKFPEAHLACADVVQISDEILLNASEEHIMFGCAPSDNIYDIPPIVVDNPREMPWRFAGVHLHGSSFNTKKLDVPWWPHGTIKLLDRTLGIMLTALGRGLENPIRRQYYGRPGEYREAPDQLCRIEYRTPSSFVLSSPALFNFMLDMGRICFPLGLQLDGEHLTFAEQAKDIILNCDADAAVKVLEQNQTFYTGLLARTGWGTYHSKKAFDTIVKGIATVKPSRSMEEEWRLNAAWRPHNNADSSGFSNLLASI